MARVNTTPIFINPDVLLGFRSIVPTTYDSQSGIFRLLREGEQQVPLDFFITLYAILNMPVLADPEVIEKINNSYVTPLENLSRYITTNNAGVVDWEPTVGEALLQRAAATSTATVMNEELAKSQQCTPEIWESEAALPDDSTISEVETEGISQNKTSGIYYPEEDFSDINPIHSAIELQKAEIPDLNKLNSIDSMYEIWTKDAEIVRKQVKLNKIANLQADAITEGNNVYVQLRDGKDYIGRPLLPKERSQLFDLYQEIGIESLQLGYQYGKIQDEIAKLETTKQEMLNSLNSALELEQMGEELAESQQFKPEIWESEAALPDDSTISEVETGGRWDRFNGEVGSRFNKVWSPIQRNVIEPISNSRFGQYAADTRLGKHVAENPKAYALAGAATVGLAGYGAYKWYQQRQKNARLKPMGSTEPKQTWVQWAKSLMPRW